MPGAVYFFTHTHTHPHRDFVYQDRLRWDVIVDDYNIITIIIIIT